MAAAEEAVDVAGTGLKGLLGLGELIHIAAPRVFAWRGAVHADVQLKLVPIVADAGLVETLGSVPKPPAIPRLRWPLPDGDGAQGPLLIQKPLKPPGQVFLVPQRVPGLGMFGVRQTDEQPVVVRGRRRRAPEGGVAVAPRPDITGEVGDLELLVALGGVAVGNGVLGKSDFRVPIAAVAGPDHGRAQGRARGVRPEPHGPVAATPQRLGDGAEPLQRQRLAEGEVRRDESVGRLDLAHHVRRRVRPV